MLRSTAIAALALLVGCATPPPPDAVARAAATTADVLLLGEQHDAEEHAIAHRRVVDVLAARGRLAALAIEMSERGTSTSGLASDSTDEAVRAALRWDERAWPWPRYAPAVLAAVRAGVPVLGANLPRAEMRAAMAEPALDKHLPAAGFLAQQRAIRDGHCGLMPDSQLVPMARVQVARDRAMAETVAGAVRPGRTVVLVTGSGHANPEVGVPRHLPAALHAESIVLPSESSTRDYCEELRRTLPRGPEPRP